MRFYLSLCLVLFIQLESEAQQEKTPLQNKIDSLEQGLLSASGKDRLEILSELNLVYHDSLFDVALGYANEFYRLSLTLGDSVNIVKGGKMVAYSLMDFEKNEEAVKILIKSLRIAQRNEEKYLELKNHIKSILNNAGIASMILGNYDQALDYQFQSLKIREKDGDKPQIIRCFNNIGLIYFNLGDYEVAEKYLMQAERLCQETNEMQLRIRVLINLGLCYIDLDKPGEAIISIKKAFSLCGTGCSETRIKEGEEGLGLALYLQKDFLKAKEKFLLSLEIAKKQKDSRYICENLNNLGQIEIALGNEELGISKLKHSLKLAEPNKLTKAKLFVYEKLFKVYKKQNDLKNSLFFLEKYIQLKDSVYSSALIKNLAKIQSDFAERENIKTIKAKDQVLLLKEELISKQKFQTILIGAVATLLLLLAGILYKFYRDKLLINIKLDQKVRERTDELRQNNSRLIQVNERQQSRLQKIGREGQSILLGIKGLCHMAQLDIVDEKTKEYFIKVDAGTDKLGTCFHELKADEV